ncbi:hypothetical protein BHM03_00051259 [Ensete ventricosum]|nr:hypothetical protein BHM03_00051259 [Ensete ventricosum]
MLPLRFPNSDIRAKQGQCPPTASPQRCGTRGDAAHGSGADHRGGRPLAGRLPAGKAAAAHTGEAAVAAQRRQRG